MVYLQSLFFFDLSAIIVMVVLAYLSKRLGEALKILPYYKLLYVTSFAIICASGLDVISETVTVPMTLFISLGLRFSAGVVALIVSLRYWNWLFVEYFKN
jgi:hypothetical protein